MNSYFGSTLTDAQNAVTQANQLSLQEDVARRNFIAMLQDAAIKRRQLEDNAAFNRDQLSLRSRGMDMDNQNNQMSQLLAALGLANQMQSSDADLAFRNKSLEQSGRLAGDELANRLDIAKLTSNREDARVAAERLRQQGDADRQTASLNEQINFENSNATSSASKYNAILEAIKQQALDKANNWAIDIPMNEINDPNVYLKNPGVNKRRQEYVGNVMNALQSILPQVPENIRFDPENMRFTPLIRSLYGNKAQGQQEPAPQQPQSIAQPPQSAAQSITNMIKAASGTNSVRVPNQAAVNPQNAAIEVKVAELANKYMHVGMSRQQAIAAAMKELGVPIVPRAAMPAGTFQPSLMSLRPPMGTLLAPALNGGN